MACDATLSSLKYSAWIRLCLSLSRAVATLFSTARNRVPRIMAILAVKASCDLRAINEGGGTFGASCRAKNVLTHTKAASLRCEAYAAHSYKVRGFPHLRQFAHQIQVAEGVVRLSSSAFV